MIRLGVFFGAVAALIAMIIVLHETVPPADPFDGIDGKQMVDLDGYRQPAIAAMKLNHAETTRPFDITLFGNSRSLRVTRELLGYDSCSFFNFSLQGSSYRNSIALLEALAHRNRAPKLAIISIDNFAIQLASNPMEIPFLDRWRSMFMDWRAAAFNSGISLPDRLRMVVRTLVAEGTVLNKVFNVYHLRRLFRDLERKISGADPLLVAGKEGYQIDGNRFRPLPLTDDGVADFRGPAKRNILPAYLRYDMKRLAALQAQGTRILLYESPVKNAPTAYPIVTATRTEFTQLCDELHLACALAPQTLPAPVKPWFDTDHAHPETLSRFIRSLLRSQPPDCAIAS